MRRMLAVADKELRQIRRDPMSLLMLVGLPAFMLVLYGFALNFDVRHVALALQDRDHSAASRDLVAAFVNSTYFDLVATPAPGDDLEALLERRVAKAVLVIPEGWSTDLAAGHDSPVQLLVDGADSTIATTALGYAGALVSQVNGARLAARAAGAGLTPPARVDYQPRVWFNPELRSSQFLVPGLMGFLLMLTAVLSTALSVVREKERGSLAQLRVAPISTAEIILGKTLPYLGLSLLTALIILLAARVLFDVVVRGPWTHLLLATLLYLVGALGFGLLISTIADSQAMAFQVGLLTSLLPAVLLSGFIFQIRSMPGWLQLVTRAVPARYYLIVLRGIILKGSGLGPYMDQMGAMAVFALVVLALAAVRLRRAEL